MAYEPIGRKGIYSYERVTLADGSWWVWKPIRDRWETTADKSYDEWLALGGTAYDESYDPVQAGGGYQNSIQTNQSVITGTGEEILNTNNTDNTQAQIEAAIGNGTATAETLEYYASHIDFTVQISKQPNRGKLFVRGLEDDFSTREFNSSLFEQGGWEFEVRENNNKSKQKYRLVAKQKSKQTVGIAGLITTPYWCLIKETIIDGQLRKDLEEQFDVDGAVINLQFALNEIIEEEDDGKFQTPTFPPMVNLNIETDDEENISSLLSYSILPNDSTAVAMGGVLEDTNLILPGGTFTIFSTNPTSSKLKKYNISVDLFKGGKKIGTQTGASHNFKLFEGNLYTIKVSAVKRKDPIQVETPIITLPGDTFAFDLSNKELVIPYRSFNSDKIIFSLGNTKRDLQPNGTLVLTSKDFTSVGQFRVYFQPVSNLAGSGPVKSIVINVTNTIDIPGPDIRNIIYPQLIKGQDFKEYDVDFKISWSSVNTNWVNIYVGKVSTATQLYEKRPGQGQLTLNVRDVLTKAGDNLDSNRDYTDFKLLFVPYNDEANKTAKGRTEEVKIRFDKGDLKLRRGSVVRDIKQAIASQFDVNVLKPETSKYLNHVLHLGNADNKLITTWGTDTETLSEFTTDEKTGEVRKTKEVKSLVFKLYEPLPTTLQPNEQVWVSKIQSIPLIEQLTILNESKEECIPLQPNFNVSFSDNVGLQIYDDLIASGSSSSTSLINQFVSSSGFNLKDLDIQFVSSSTTLIEFDNGGKLVTESVDADYYWENFVKYSSAEERVENFIYKINTIDFYLNRLDLVTSGSHYTSSIALQKEKENIEYKINDIKANFDAFEDYLYTNEITSSTESSYANWYGGILSSAQEYDYNNSNRLTYNLPSHITEDKNNAEYTLFFDMVGQHFDTLYLYNREIARSRKLEHKHQSGLIDKLIYQMLESLGWDADLGTRTQALWDYAFGTEADGTQTSELSGKQRQNEIWRRILNNLPYLLKTKGTKRAMHALLSCYGIPASMLTVMEFGGPRDVNESGTTAFTYEDRTAAINLSGASAITIDWKQYNGDFPNTVEVRLNTTKRQEQRIISGDDWSLDILTDTGSRGKVQLTVGSVSSSIQPLPIFDDEYYHIAVTRESGSNFTLYVKQGFQERIRNEESITLTALDESWTSGSSIQFGGSTFDGSIDEIRLWTTPLIETVIENHTLLPDAINGNHNSASSEDLIFRNDFEYPKNRGVDTDIKNVALIQTYATSSVASGFESITEYPYNYTPYDRTVTAQVPSSGINYSNKFRFESQYQTNSTSQLTSTSSIDLSHKQRSTKRSFDQSPIDSDRLGLFFSPIKEINMDILRSVGPINVDDFIGDPSDDYNYTYESLDNFRQYYFQRYNLNFNEYVQLVRYIERGLFDQLESLAPARAKVAKGLLFEPHILERSKTQWTKPTAQENTHEASVDTNEDRNVTSQELTHLALVSASEDTHLRVETPFYEGLLSGAEDTRVIGEKSNFEGLYIVKDDTNQTGEIVRNSEATMGGFEFNIEAVLTASIDTFYVNSSYEHIGGFGPDDLAVAGFGLYGSGSHAIRTRLVGGNIVKDRVKAFKFDEAYTEYQRENLDYNDPSRGTEIVEKPRYRTKVSILPFTGSDGNESPDIVADGTKIFNVVPLDGTFSTHYRFVEDVTTGLENSFFNGSKQTSATTLDGGPAVVTFTTNPNTLKVSETGRGSGEPILEVD